MPSGIIIPVRFRGFVVKFIGHLRASDDPPYIPCLKARGFTALLDKF
jgi:hypothetical protein